MSPLHRATFLSVPPSEADAASPLTHQYALLEELSFVRREAQAEADLAYADWSRRPGDRLAFAVYQAARDRADAAEDDLAHLTRELAEVTA